MPRFVLEWDNTKRIAEQDFKTKWWKKVMQLYLVHVEIWKQLWKILMSVWTDDNWWIPGWTSSLTADTPQRRESEHVSSAESKNLLAVCVATDNEMLCDTPAVDFSEDRAVKIGKFPEDELKAGRELELNNMLLFDFLNQWKSCVLEITLWHGFCWWVARSPGEITTLCSSISGLGSQGLLVCGMARHVFHQGFVGKCCELKRLRNLCHWHSLLLSCTLEQKSSNFWRLKTTVNGTRNGSEQWQEHSYDKLVTSLLFQQMTSTSASTKCFLKIWTNSTVTIWRCAD